MGYSWDKMKVYVINRIFMGLNESSMGYSWDKMKFQRHIHGIRSRFYGIFTRSNEGVCNKSDIHGIQ